MSESLTFNSEAPQGRGVAIPRAAVPKESSVERVRVVVRCRPPTSDEGSAPTCCMVDPAANEVSLHDPRGLGLNSAKIFTFDAVYGTTSTQAEVYNGTARPIVDSVLSGYNGTIFAYGQTGTGKTFTMEGTTESGQAGLIPSAFNQVFETIGNSSDTQFLVRASFLEIYNEQVRDLLGKDPSARLELKEHRDSGVYVKGLGSFVVKNVQEMTALLEVGKKNRSVGATAMNQDSSRSHSMFTIIVERTDQPNAAGGGHIKAGKLNLVDLAGSERQAKTQATGMRLKEATRINLSLSALGNVISALVDGNGGHVPYRDSKLTRLLQDSLGGNSRTVMLAAVGPSIAHYEETLSTLRYASRAKNIRNKPHINEDPKNALMREMQAEIAALRRQLAAAATGTPHSGQPSLPRTPEQDEALAVEFEQRVRMEVAARAEAVQKQEEAVKQRAAALQAEIKALREQNFTLQQDRLSTVDYTQSLDIHCDNVDPAGEQQCRGDGAEGRLSNALLKGPNDATWSLSKNRTAGAPGVGPLLAAHACDSRGEGTAQASDGSYADVQAGNGDGLGLARAAGDGHVQAEGVDGNWDSRGAGDGALQGVPGGGGVGARPSTEIRGQAGAADLESAARRSRRRSTSRRSSRADIEQRLAALEGTLLRGADTAEWAPAPGTIPVHTPELATPSSTFQPVSSTDTNGLSTPPHPMTSMPGGTWGSPSHAMYMRPSTSTAPRGTWGPPEQNMGSGSGPGADSVPTRPSTGTWGPSWAAPQHSRGGGSGWAPHGLPTLAPVRGGHSFGGVSPEGARRMLPSLGSPSMGERGSPYGLPGMTRYSDGYPVSRHWSQEETARTALGREGTWQDMWNTNAQGFQHSHPDSQHFQGTDQEDGMELVLRANVLEVECEAIADELARVAASWQAERGNLMEELASLQQDLALKDLIVSSFIPPREVEKLLARAVWDEDREEWILQPGQGPAGGRPLAAWRESRLAGQMDRSVATPDGCGMEDSWAGPVPMSPVDAGLAWRSAPQFANQEAFHDPNRLNQMQWSEPFQSGRSAQPPDMLLITAEEQPILLPNTADFDTPQDFQPHSYHQA